MLNSHYLLKVLVIAESTKFMNLHICNVIVFLQAGRVESRIALNITRTLRMTYFELWCAHQ